MIVTLTFARWFRKRSTWPFFVVVVVNPDLRSELDLLDLDLRLVLPRELRLLLLLVAVLPVVHDPGHRRIRLGRDLDEIEVLRVRVLASLVRLLDPELLPLLVDEPDTRDADRVVDACLRLGTARRLPGTSCAASNVLHQARVDLLL